MRKRISGAILRMSVLVLIPLSFACSSMDCSMNSMVMCNYKLIDSLGNEASLKGVLSVSITRKDAGLQDTTLLNKLTGTGTFSLPMSYSLPEDEMHFIYAPTAEAELGIIDVVKISKQDEPVFESVECTPRFNHVIESVNSTNNFIDSVVVKNNKVSNDATKTHIYIYLRNTVK